MSTVDWISLALITLTLVGLGWVYIGQSRTLKGLRELDENLSALFNRRRGL